MTGPPVPQFDEAAFRRWYTEWASRAGIDPDPDNPLHKYDYRAAYRAGAKPEIDAGDGLYHWPSEFKADDHPNRFVKGVDTKALDGGDPNISSMLAQWRAEHGRDWTTRIRQLPDASRVSPRRSEL